MQAVTRDNTLHELEMTGEPVTTLLDGVGYGTASIPCVTPDVDLRGAVVKVPTADPWFGLVIDNPAPGAPLEAVGFGYVGTMQRREVLYCDSDVSPWRDRTYNARNPNLSPSASGNAIRFDIGDGTECGSLQAGAFRIVPTSGTQRVTFGWNRPALSVGLALYYGTYNPRSSDGEETSGGWVQVWSQAAGAGAFFGSASVDVTGSRNAFMFIVEPNGYTITGSSTSVVFDNVKVYGTSVTSVTASNVLKDILANEIDPYYLPAGRIGYIQTDATDVTPLVYGHSNPNPKIEELMTRSSYRFGWYSERFSGLYAPAPHWEPTPTTPVYVIDLDETGAQIDDGPLDPIASAIDVVWTGTDGVQHITRTYDTDRNHRLVQLGMNTATTAKVAEVQAPVDSEAKALAVAAVALESMGREQLRGTDEMVVRDIGGNVVPASKVRPNRLALVYGLKRPILSMIRESEATGDSVCKVTLDNTSYRLEQMLARLSAGQGVSV